MEPLKKVEEALRAAGYRFSYTRLQDAMKEGKITVGYGQGGIHVDRASAFEWADQHLSKAKVRQQPASAPLFDQDNLARIAKALEEISTHLAKWNS
jgi:hypothetical protein